MSTKTNKANKKEKKKRRTKRRQERNFAFRNRSIATSAFNDQFFIF